MRKTLLAACTIMLAVFASPGSAADPAAYAKLEQAHPDWREIVRSQAYASWAVAQPESIRAKIIRNGNELVDADEAIEVFSLFKNNSGNSPEAPATLTETCKGSVEKGLAAWNRGDGAKAYCYWIPKALAGDAAAQNNIGMLWDHGASPYTPTNGNEAARWFSLAANQGLVLAMNNLAQLQLRSGFRDQALSWLNLAARWGDATAQSSLASLGLAAPAPDLALARQQQQAVNDAAMGQAAYAIGCAIGGGCARPGGSVRMPMECRSTMRTDIRGNPVYRCE